MYRKPKKSCEKGFSLIELSIVLVIVGLLMSAGVGMMKNMREMSRISKEKSNLAMIKNSLVSYALSRGKLPSKNCATPPCELPYVELNLSSVSKDTNGLPYGYDVTDRLTQTNSGILCSILFELDNYYTWLGSPANAGCGGSDLVCVTNTTDVDNGNIGTAGQGYYLAAYIVSRGEDKVFGAKNSNGDREYEMSSNPYDSTVGRDDLVIELSFGELSANICNAQNTKIEVTILGGGKVWYSDSDGCLSGGLDTATASLGKKVYYNNGMSNSCDYQISFVDLAKCDAGLGVSNCASGTTFDGQVDIVIP